MTHSGPSCESAVSMPYTKADKAVTLYEQSAAADAPGKCSYSTNKVFVWGSTRNKFKKLICKSAMNAASARNFPELSCDYEELMLKNYTYNEVATWLKHDRINSLHIAIFPDSTLRCRRSS